MVGAGLAHRAGPTDRLGLPGRPARLEVEEDGVEAPAGGSGRPCARLRRGAPPASSRHPRSASVRSPTARWLPSAGFPPAAWSPGALAKAHPRVGVIVPDGPVEHARTAARARARSASAGAHSTSRRSRARGVTSTGHNSGKAARSRSRTAAVRNVPLPGPSRSGPWGSGRPRRSGRPAQAGDSAGGASGSAWLSIRGASRPPPPRYGRSPRTRSAGSTSKAAASWRRLTSETLTSPRSTWPT